MPSRRKKAVSASSALRTRMIHYLNFIMDIYIQIYSWLIPGGFKASAG
jgi:hypothetical protein